MPSILSPTRLWPGEHRQPFRQPSVAEWACRRLLSLVLFAIAAAVAAMSTAVAAAEASMSGAVASSSSLAEAAAALGALAESAAASVSSASAFLGALAEAKQTASESTAALLGSFAAAAVSSSTVRGHPHDADGHVADLAVSSAAAALPLLELLEGIGDRLASGEQRRDHHQEGDDQARLEGKSSESSAFRRRPLLEHSEPQ